MKINYGCLAALCLFSFLGILQAEEKEAAESNSLKSVTDFIGKNLIGRTLETKVTTKISDDTLETEFERRTLYLNLKKSETTATFDSILLIKQKVWDLDKDGKRVKDEPRFQDRTMVLRFHLRKSASTGELLGSVEVLTNSTSEFCGSIGDLRMWLEDEKLMLVTSTILYFDGFAAKGEMVPMASVKTIEFSLNKGELQTNNTEDGFDVNPITLERKPNNHHVALKEHEIKGLF